MAGEVNAACFDAATMVSRVRVDGTHGCLVWSLAPVFASEGIYEILYFENPRNEKSSLCPFWLYYFANALLRDEER